MSRGDWVPCRGYGSQFSLSAAGLSRVDVLCVRHGNPLSGTSSDATIEFADDLVVQRTIGQLDGEVDEGSGILAMRLRVALYDDTLDQTAFYTDNLFDEDGANEAFLWQRYVRLTAGPGLLDIFADPWWGSLDVRVGRRIPRDQALFLSFQWLDGLTGSTFRGVPYIRTRAMSR